MKQILIVDCFDSFTYNLYHYLDDLNGGGCEVVRYDEFNPSEASQFSHIVLSPGPGLPEEYPKILSFLKDDASQQNILGICLGLQCLAVSAGGKLLQLKHVLHGVQSNVMCESDSVLYKDVLSSFEVGHYHSWVVDEASLGDAFKITSRNTEGLIMSFENKKLHRYGIQFHPESVMTPVGKKLLENWLKWS